MLRQIISITGRPGLFKILSQGNRNLIVEDLITKNRFPVGMRDKVVSLGDIAMYTESEDLPLDIILDRVFAHEEGQPVDVKKLTDKGGLRDEFAAIVEDYDRDRVHDSDIRKLFNWYNILIQAGFTKFHKEEDTVDAAETPDA